MPTLRRDAARNRDRIIAAARQLNGDGRSLQLNVVAREADVGIGTVYRHFPSPEALGEAMVEDSFAELIALARAALENSEAAEALREFLAEAMQKFVAEPAFATAATNASPVREETRQLRTELLEAFAALVARSQPSLRPGLDALDLMILLCGLGYSARLRPERTRAYLDLMMAELFL